LTRFVGLSGALYLALSAVGHPLLILKTRLQHSGGTAAHAAAASALAPGATVAPGGALRALARGVIGLRGLYVGFWPASLGALPSEAAYVTTIEAVRQALAPAQDRRVLGAADVA
jgi:hypothetical protein